MPDKKIGGIIAYKENMEKIVEIDLYISLFMLLKKNLMTKAVGKPTKMSQW